MTNIFLSLRGKYILQNISPTWRSRLHFIDGSNTVYFFWLWGTISCFFAYAEMASLNAANFRIQQLIKQSKGLSVDVLTDNCKLLFINTNLSSKKYTAFRWPLFFIGTQFVKLCSVFRSGQGTSRFVLARNTAIHPLFSPCLRYISLINLFFSMKK